MGQNIHTSLEYLISATKEGQEGEMEWREEGGREEERSVGGGADYQFWRASLLS